MDDLLTPISTTYLKSNQDDEPLLSEVKPSKGPKVSDARRSVSTAEEALEALKAQPDYDSLIAILRFLVGETKASDGFQLFSPVPQSAAIVHILVSEICPNYWMLLSEGVDDGRDAELLLVCLRSVTGLNAVLAHLKAFIQQLKDSSKDPQRQDLVLNLKIFLELLAALLKGHNSIRAAWVASTSQLADAALRKPQTHSLVSLITSGRVVSTAAEASALIGRENLPSSANWLADGLEFSRWVGRNIASWAILVPKEDELQACSDIFQRSTSLGYFDSVIKILVESLLLAPVDDNTNFVRVCFQSSRASAKILHILLDYLSQRFLDKEAVSNTDSNPLVSAVAGIIDTVVGTSEARKNSLISWCITSTGAGLGNGIGIRRSVMAVLAQDREAVTTVLERSLNQFGDLLYIRHSPILQQEVHCQMLLLSAGYVSRLSPIKLTMLLRSSVYLSAISHRIAATQARARFLGMVVGETLSSLVDGNAKKLDFHMEEMDTDDAYWYKAVAKVSDSVGPVGLILNPKQQLSLAEERRQPTSKPKARPKPKTKAPVASAPSIPKAVIEEIDSSDDEDDDLVPYAKQSDPEDSDEDATLVQRNKVKPPVYIRDLVTFLRDSESYDKQKLGLKTAPLLIRRKANHGTEVSFHAEDLGRLLVAIEDKFEIEDFADLRLQGMIALVVAQPALMAPWFARTFFEGDYSLSQRVSVLVTLGLSARELAGFESSKYQSETMFPSKRLPEKIEGLYLESANPAYGSSTSELKALPPTALNTIADSLTSSFLAPLAVEAADASTGPDVLKLQSFTARYKTKSKTTKPRVRAIPNTTAALLSTYFFSPLTAHFQRALRSSKPIVLNPAMLSLYLQTLGITIHAAGPSTLSLPQLTSELWDLLLSVRSHVQADLDALKGWFVAMASLLEANEGDMRRLCEAQGREVMETREWVAGIFEKTRGEDGGEENDVKMLAAGVLIKLGEAIEKFQALLMGDLAGFS